MISIMQGDAYDIPVTLKDKDGNAITDADVSAVKITLGSTSKSYPDEVTFDDGVFLFPVTQEESFRMDGFKQLEARVKFTSGEVMGCKLDFVLVGETRFYEIL